MWWPWYARLVYNVARSDAHEGYVLAAEVVGALAAADPAAALSAQMARLAADPQLHGRLTREGYASARGFSLDRVARMYLEDFETLLGS